jgi:hypothetical protein
LRFLDNFDDSFLFLKARLIVSLLFFARYFFSPQEGDVITVARVIWEVVKKKSESTIETIAWINITVVNGTIPPKLE